jgi:hypothetical protein
MYMLNYIFLHHRFSCKTIDTIKNSLRLTHSLLANFVYLNEFMTQLLQSIYNTDQVPWKIFHSIRSSFYILKLELDCRNLRTTYSIFKVDWSRFHQMNSLLNFTQLYFKDYLHYQMCLIRSLSNQRPHSFAHIHSTQDQHQDHRIIKIEECP